MPPRPAVLRRFASRTRRRRPARSTTADSAWASRAEASDRVADELRGPYDEWRTRDAAPLPSLVATVMHFIPVVPRRRDGAGAAVHFRPSHLGAVRGGGPPTRLGRSITTRRARARGGLRVDGRREHIPIPSLPPHKRDDATPRASARFRRH